MTAAVSMRLMTSEHFVDTDNFAYSTHLCLKRFSLQAILQWLRLVPLRPIYTITDMIGSLKDLAHTRSYRRIEYFGCPRSHMAIRLTLLS
jgi:hypothetical protein